MSRIPVIAIDGPSGSGKGTVSRLIAQRLGWHFLDSGILYRLVAFVALQRSISFQNKVALTMLAAHLDVEFRVSDEGLEGTILLEGQEVTDVVRSEECGQMASMVAALPAVRQALLNRQRAFCKFPGLVADGRDMGTVVFPRANLKVFLTATPEERAQRRYKQLNEKGIGANLQLILSDLIERDERDSVRSVAPLRSAVDATVIDTTALSVKAVVDQILCLWGQVLAKGI